jgi:hypothetical protein
LNLQYGAAHVFDSGDVVGQNQDFIADNS